MSSTNSRLKLEKRRDFGDLIQDTFQFFFQELAPFLKGFIMLAGPIYLFSGILSAVWADKNEFTMDKIFNPNPEEPPFSSDGNIKGPMEMLGAFISWEFIMVILLGFAGYLMAISVVYTYLELYRKNQKSPDFSVLSQQSFANLGKVLLTTIIISLFFLLVYLVGVAALVGVAVGISTFAQFLGIVLAILLGLGLIVGLIYLLAPTYLAYPMILSEKNISPVTAIRESFVLTKGKRWMTVGLMLVMSILIWMGSSFLSIPQLVTGFVGGFWAELPVQSFIQVVISLGSSILNALIFISMGLLYYSLNSESGDVSLESRIDEIGKPDESI